MKNKHLRNKDKVDLSTSFRTPDKIMNPEEFREWYYSTMPIETRSGQSLITRQR